MLASPSQSHTTSTLARDVCAAIDEADALLKSAVESGDDTLSTLRAQYSERLRSISEQLDHLQRLGVDGARNVVRTADQRVHEHPYGAMAMAATAGLLIGFLASRRG